MITARNFLGAPFSCSLGGWCKAEGGYWCKKVASRCKTFFCSGIVGVFILSTQQITDKPDPPRLMAGTKNLSLYPKSNNSQ